MSCSCSINSGDDCTDVSSTRHPTARKEHQCGECYRLIKKGEVYELYNSCYDGSWNTHKTCIDCESIRNALFCSFSLETLWDDVLYHYQGSEPPSSECMTLLTKPARDKLCDIIEDGWND